MGAFDEDGNVFCCYSCTGLITMMIIPASMIVLGSYYIHSCPMEPMIPKFMIISGIFSILFIIFLYCSNVYSRWHRENLTKCSIIISVILYIFIFAWNLAGAYWVFKEWHDWDGETKTSCNEGTYLYIFALCIVYWILLPLNCFAFFKRSKDLYEEA